MKYDDLQRQQRAAIIRQVEDTPTGVTIRLFADQYSETIFSSGAPKSAILAPLGYLICDFLSATPEELERCLAPESDRRILPFLHLREFQLEYAIKGAYIYKIVQARFLRYLNLCLDNSMPISLASFSSFMILYNMSVPEFSYFPHYTPEEEARFDSLRSKTISSAVETDAEIVQFMSDRLAQKHHEKVFFCTLGEYEPSLIEQACIAFMYQILDNGFTFKKCALCGKWFVPKKTDEKYCRRESPLFSGKSCRNAARYQKQLVREHSSESVRIYKSINTMKAKKVKEAISSSARAQALTDLNKFRDDADAWKKKIKNGEESQENYIDWLNSFKKRRNQH